MKFAEFHNNMRIMLNIDRDVLESAGVIEFGDNVAWEMFIKNPFMWFIRAPTQQAQKLWALIEKSGNQNG